MPTERTAQDQEHRANAVSNYAGHLATLTLMDENAMPPVIEVRADGTLVDRAWVDALYASHEFTIDRDTHYKQHCERFARIAKEVDVCEASISFEGQPVGVVLVVAEGDAVLARRYWEACMRKKRLRLSRRA